MRYDPVPRVDFEELTSVVWSNDDEKLENRNKSEGTKSRTDDTEIN